MRTYLSPKGTGIPIGYLNELYLTLLETRSALDNSSLALLRDGCVDGIAKQKYHEIANIRMRNKISLGEIEIAHKYHGDVPQDHRGLISIISQLDDEYYETWMGDYYLMIHGEEIDVRIVRDGILVPVTTHRISSSNPILLVGWEDVLTKYVMQQVIKNNHLWIKPKSEIRDGIAAWKWRKHLLMGLAISISDRIENRIINLNRNDWPQWLGKTVIIDLTSMIHPSFHSQALNSRNSDTYLEILVERMNSKLRDRLRQGMGSISGDNRDAQLSLLLDEMKLLRAEKLQEIKHKLHLFDTKQDTISEHERLTLVSEFDDAAITQEGRDDLFSLLDIISEISAGLGVKFILTYTLGHNITINSPKDYVLSSRANGYEAYFLDFLGEVREKLEKYDEQCLVAHTNSPFIIYLQGKEISI